jgi:hypothetical protein
VKIAIKIMIAKSASGTISRQLMERMVSATNQMYLVIDAGSPVAAFTARRELKAYLWCRLDAFANLLVYTFWGNQGPSIMTMTAALAE